MSAAAGVWHAGIWGCRDFMILGFGDAAPTAAGFWDLGILGFRDLECRDLGLQRFGNAGMLRCRDFGMLGFGDAGIWGCHAPESFTCSQTQG